MQELMYQKMFLILQRESLAGLHRELCFTETRQGARRPEWVSRESGAADPALLLSFSVT